MPEYPDRHMLDAVIAVLIALVCLALAIRMLLRPVAATISVIVIELLLCLSLIDDTVLNAQSAYLTPPDTQQFIDLVLVTLALRLLLFSLVAHKET